MRGVSTPTATTERKDFVLREQKKGNRFRMIFIILILFIAVSLITWGVLTIIKKNKAKQFLDQSSGGSSNTTSSNTSSNSSGSSVSVNTPNNIKAVQSAINAAHPEAKLDVDGIAGPLTQAAIKKYYGPSAYPLTQDSLQQIITGQAPNTPRPNTTVAIANDNFPLVVGSKGNLITGLKNMIRGISPMMASSYGVDPKNDVFDDNTRTALVTGVGSKYYPVTSDLYTELAQVYSAKNPA